MNPPYSDRAGSFHRAAEVYERAGPGYPRPAADWAVGTKQQRVLDLAAGTGKLTTGSCRWDLTSLRSSHSNR